MCERKVSKDQSESKKVSSNRRNSLKSTGPKTPQGKRKVSLNALKHGLLAKEVVIKSGDGKENEAEFERLLEALQEDLKPVGSLESMLVERIAVSYWRLRRVLRCEVGELRAQLDIAELDFHTKWRSDLELPIGLLHCDIPSDSVLRPLEGVRYLIGILDRVESEVVETRFVTAETHRELALCFDHAEYNLAELCRSFVVSDPEEIKQRRPERPSLGDPPWLDDTREYFLLAVDYETSNLEDRLANIEKLEKLRMDSMASLSLPKKEAAERITRYETTIERQLYRGVNPISS